MKKILLSAVVMAVMSTNLMATVGTLTKVLADSQGNVYVTVKQADDSLRTRPFLGTADAIKAMTAVALTAKTTGVVVDLNPANEGGVAGWSNISF